MRKPISPRVHGAIDYTTVAATAALPRALDFPPRAEALCYALAGGYLAISLLTDYPLSVRRLIPFKGHGIAEGVIGLALPALPWALDFADHRPARNFFVGLTALTAVVAALTDWSGRSRSAGASRRRKRGPGRAIRKRVAA
jgi:hypothetical protein